MDSSMLGMNLFVIVTMPVAERERIKEALPEHLAHQVRIEKEGILFAAGPLFDENGETPAAGMIVVRARDFAEARAIADRDPMHARGLRSYTVQRWVVNEGRYTVTVDYSDQTARIS